LSADEDSKLRLRFQVSLIVVLLREIVNGLNGISCPVFGVQWTPPVLEDRRVLYNPFAWEEPGHCVESVLEIRRFLTEELGHLPPSSELASNLKAVRGACRKFLA
jgi:hypothetical protein